MFHLGFWRGQKQEGTGPRLSV